MCVVCAYVHATRSGRLQQQQGTAQINTEKSPPPGPAIVLGTMADSGEQFYPLRVKRKINVVIGHCYLSLRALVHPEFCSRIEAVFLESGRQMGRGGIGVWFSTWGSVALVTAPQPHRASPKVASPRIPTLPCCFLAHNGPYPAEQGWWPHPGKAG